MSSGQTWRPTATARGKSYLGVVIFESMKGKQSNDARRPRMQTTAGAGVCLFAALRIRLLTWEHVGLLEAFTSLQMKATSERHRTAKVRCGARVRLVRAEAGFLRTYS